VLLNPSIEQLKATESHEDYSSVVTKCELGRKRRMRSFDGGCGRERK
jgi:hypothetical protein